MSVDLNFESNAGYRWTNCGAVFMTAICPLCSKVIEDPMFFDFVKEQYDLHMLEHAGRGEPHEMTA